MVKQIASPTCCHLIEYLVYAILTVMVPDLTYNLGGIAKVLVFTEHLAWRREKRCILRSKIELSAESNETTDSFLSR